MARASYFFRATTEEGRLRTGNELYNLLFPPKTAGPARKVVEGMMASSLGSTSKAPSLWIRLLPRNERLPYALPLGMLAVPVGNVTKFLGFSFRLVTPLPVLDYRPVEGCISDWIFVLPPNDAGTQPEFTTARKEFRPWTGACPGSRCKEDFEQFRDWIGGRGPEPNAEPNSVALYILAHHGPNGISFDQRNVMSEQGVTRDFLKPSIAILNACGTAGPGAYGFVKKFSAQGFSSIVAPVTEVSPLMAGQYTKALADVLNKHQNESAYTLSDAQLETLRNLQPKFGSLILSYTLLGNGNLRLCAPPHAK